MPRRRKRRKNRAAVLLLLACMAVLAVFGARQLQYLRYPLRYSETVERYATVRGLPPSFLYAVICTESGFDPQARSDVDALGLMQITEDALSWAQMRLGDETVVSTQQLFDPEINIRYGSYIYALLIEEFGSVKTAVCAYHAGRGNVLHWLQDPDYSSDGKEIDHIPYSNTAWYWEHIEKAQEAYRRLYDLE